MGTARIPAVSFGVWSLLELIDCDFVHPMKDPTAGGAVLAGYIAANGRAATGLVLDFVEKGYDKEELKLDDIPADNDLAKMAAGWAVVHQIQPEDFAKLREWLDVGFAGFGMIPGGSGGGECLFGMDSFAAIVAAIGSDMGYTYDALLWDVPLCMLGHVAAQKSKQNGAKGIERPKDQEHMREQFAEAQRRFEAGLLYEWQEREPWRYDLDGHENEDEAYRFAVLQHEAKYGKQEAV